MKTLTAVYSTNISDGWGLGDDATSLPRGYRLLHAKMVVGLAKNPDIFGQYTQGREDDGYNWIQLSTHPIDNNWEEVRVTAPKWVWELVK